MPQVRPSREDLVKTYDKVDFHDRGSLEKAVAGALRQAINAHGPITPEWIGSATKRIMCVLKNRNRIIHAAKEESNDATG